MSGATRVVFSSRAAAFLALALASQAHAAEPPPRSPELRELFRQADAAVERMDVARARELWAQIHDIEPSTAALCQLGQLDLRLGRWEAAAEELSRCVEQMPEPTNDKERRRFEVRHADFAAVRRQVGRIHVLPPPRSTRALVDGREVDAARGVYVAPGHHEVTAMGPRGEIARALVKIAAGETLSVPLTFEARLVAATPETPAAPARPSPRPTPSGKPTPSGPRPWIVGAGATAAVAALAAGVGLHLAADSADDEAESIRSKTENEPMSPSDAAYKAMYEQAMGAHERATTLHAVGSAALVTGAALGAATLVYVALPYDAEVRARAGYAELVLVW